MAHDRIEAFTWQFIKPRNHRQDLCFQLKLKFFRGAEPIIHDVQSPDDQQTRESPQHQGKNSRDRKAGRNRSRRHRRQAGNLCANKCIFVQTDAVSMILKLTLLCVEPFDFAIEIGEPRKRLGQILCLALFRIESRKDGSLIFFVLLKLLVEVLRQSGPQFRASHLFHLLSLNFRQLCEVGFFDKNLIFCGNDLWMIDAVFQTIVTELRTEIQQILIDPLHVKSIGAAKPHGVFDQLSPGRIQGFHGKLQDVFTVCNRALQRGGFGAGFFGFFASESVLSSQQLDCLRHNTQAARLVAGVHKLRRGGF